MQIFRYLAIVFVSCSVFCVALSVAETNRFTFCSRILSADERADVVEDTKSQGFGASDGDPIVCKRQGGTVSLKDGLQASSCQESVVDLTGSDSSFARKLEVGVVKRTVCFKHNVPMGGSDLSDDSPRCFRGNNQPFLMFVAKTCRPNSKSCTTHWLLAIDGKCDGSPVNQLSSVKETNGSSLAGGVGSNQAGSGDQTRGKPPPPARVPELSNVPLPPVSRDGK
ncbi:hypothetical protein BSKO_12461 [Bryopsis sp. KO-2023]|nr:hypothetical protein BSKO_12461 [Bryopsis sp. KO-2023]